VRTYLREHLDASKWEEVRWWPTKALDAANARKIAAERQTISYLQGRVNNLAKRGDDDPVDKQEIKERSEDLEALAKAPAPRVLRLKYRTGGKLNDACFEIENGKAKPAPTYWLRSGRVPGIARPFCAQAVVCVLAARKPTARKVSSMSSMVSKLRALRLSHRASEVSSRSLLETSIPTASNDLIAEMAISGRRCRDRVG
jgi:hypothetical protein